jgi:tRNA(Ile)-lysidine synthase
VIPFISSVRDTIARHQMLAPRDRVLAGVSGGADSTALLLVLCELGYDVAAAHLNHGLRGRESDEDENFVKKLAGNLGVACFTRSVKIDPDAGNIEAAGREARKTFFHSLVAEQGFTKVALAHNREDRAETFMLHLLRGAGSEGLVSMAPVTRTTVRPLIESPRAEIQAYLESKGQPWQTDRTNADISFARNRIRQEILPELASLFNSRLVDTLTRTITILQDEDQWMRELAQAWLDEYGGAGLDVEAMRRVPPALARRLIREALRRDGWSLTDLTFDHVEAVRGLLEEGKSGKTIQLPGAVVAAREFNRLIFRSPSETVAEFAYDLPIPGTVHVPELGRVFRAICLADVSEASALSESPARALVDGSLLPACVKIRNWKPGDYYNPAGWPAGKVKKLFQRARVPRSQRRHWPIFVTESKIVWVTSFPVSREFTPSSCSEKIVAFEALEG